MQPRHAWLPREIGGQRRILEGIGVYFDNIAMLGREATFVQLDLNIVERQTPSHPLTRGLNGDVLSKIEVK